MAIPNTGIYVTGEINSIYKTAIRDLRTDLGRTCFLHFGGLNTICPNCLRDDENDISAGVYLPISPYPTGVSGPTSFTGGLCPVCSGTDYISNTPATSGIQVLLKRLRDKDREFQGAGQRDFMNWRIKADIGEYVPILTCDYISMEDDVDADGNQMRSEVTSIRKRGLKDDANVEAFLKRSDNAGNAPNRKLT